MIAEEAYKGDRKSSLGKALSWFTYFFRSQLTVSCEDVHARLFQVSDWKLWRAKIELPLLPVVLRRKERCNSEGQVIPVITQSSQDPRNQAGHQLKEKSVHKT